MACASCARKRLSQASIPRKVIAVKDCTYTLDQLNELLPLVTIKEKPYVISQINIYNKRCYALENVINGLITKYLS